MRNNKARLAFEMLEKEMEVMRLYEMEAVKGGTGSGDVEIEWGIDPDGNYYYREKGTETWTAYEALDEVVITPSGNSYNPFEDYNWMNNHGYNPYYPTEDSNNFSSGNYSTGGVTSTGYSTGIDWSYYGGNSPTGAPVNVFYCGTTNENGEHSVSNPNSEYNSAGYNSAGYNSSGYNSAGYNSAGLNTSGFDESFVNLLDATGTTADAFAGVMETTLGIARMGDFATEAKVLLEQFGKYAGPVGNILGIIVDGIAIYQDGQMTREELVSFLTSQVTGGIIGSVPIAGGILATLYDVSGADDWVQGQIVTLIDEYFPESVVTP